MLVCLYNDSFTQIRNKNDAESTKKNIKPIQQNRGTIQPTCPQPSNIKLNEKLTKKETTTSIQRKVRQKPMFFKHLKLIAIFCSILCLSLEWCAWGESNPRPLASETNALSN